MLEMKGMEMEEFQNKKMSNGVCRVDEFYENSGNVKEVVKKLVGNRAMQINSIPKYRKERKNAERTPSLKRYKSEAELYDRHDFVTPPKILPKRKDNTLIPKIYQTIPRTNIKLLTIEEIDGNEKSGDFSEFARHSRIVREALVAQFQHEQNGQEVFVNWAPKNMRNNANNGSIITQYTRDTMPKGNKKIDQYDAVIAQLALVIDESEMENGTNRILENRYNDDIDEKEVAKMRIVHNTLEKINRRYKSRVRELIEKFENMLI